MRDTVDYGCTINQKRKYESVSGVVLLFIANRKVIHGIEISLYGVDALAQNTVYRLFG